MHIRFAAAAAIVLAPSIASADLVYSHDENGNGVDGNPSSLTQAVQSGKSITVSYTSGGIAWYRSCPNVSVYNGVVSCYIDVVLDTTEGGALARSIFHAPSRPSSMIQLATERRSKKTVLTVLS